MREDRVGKNRVSLHDTISQEEGLQQKTLLSHVFEDTADIKLQAVVLPEHL